MQGPGTRRIAALAIFSLLAAAVLFLRLAMVQLWRGRALAAAAVAQRAVVYPLGLPRGEIYDRKLRSLTDGYRRISAVLFPHLVKDPGQAVDQIARVLRRPRQEVKALVSPGKGGEGRGSLRLAENLDPFTARRLESLGIAGLVVAEERVRYGPGALATHLVGYLEAPNRGVAGLEKGYDDYLRGEMPEAVASMVDAGGRAITGLGYRYRRPLPDALPYDLVLTIDAGIQALVEEVMDRRVRKGAVVVADARSGDILAMASRPNFDPERVADFGEDDGGAPLWNRAVKDFPPGSTFKLVVAAAALEEGVARPESRFFCPGFIDVGSQRIRGWCYERGGHGELNFRDALAHSSNPVFIQVGLRLGADRLLQYARLFGLGARVLDKEGGPGLPEESPGHLPLHARGLLPGDVANLSIGQGSITATPLQMAQVVQAIANDGVLVPLRLARELRTPYGLVARKFPRSDGRRVISRTTAGELRDALLAGTAYGTGRAARVPAFGAGGKTGTAETGRSTAAGEDIAHAWFVGFAPAYYPLYVASVFVEEGMSGAAAAAPVFREIMEGLLR